jgi:hypothetical protein
MASALTKMLQPWAMDRGRHTIKTARHHEHFISAKSGIEKSPGGYDLRIYQRKRSLELPNNLARMLFQILLSRCLRLILFPFSRPPIALIRQLIARRYWVQKVQPHAHLHIAIGIAVRFQGFPASQACKIAKLQLAHNSQARLSFAGLGKLVDCFAIPGASIILGTV